MQADPRPVILTCAVTGSADTGGKNPHVPVTPREIANDIAAVAKAGAAIAHIHVRDPATGRESRDPALFAEVAALVRAAGTDILLNFTSAIGTFVAFDKTDPGRLAPEHDFLPPDRRTEHIRADRPEICSLDTANMLMHGEPYLNLPDHCRAIARTARDHGVKPEIEVFHEGDLLLARDLLDEGLFDGPPFVQMILGVRYGTPATTPALLNLLSQMPTGAVWSAVGLGRMQMPVLAQSVLLGGHGRVGLEDNLWLAKGVPATNTDLVNAAVTIVRALGHQPATTTETRSILGLRA
jgi:uncharacterized protein (DUF849 family)